MDLSKYVTQLREDLASAAAAGDEQTQRTAALLGAAIEPAARLALMIALSDLAAEVTAALPDQVVEVRLDGRDVRVAVSGTAEPEPEPEPAPTSGFGGFGGFGQGGDAGDISRITLRLVEQIKGQAEQAAAQQGVSLNSWVAQAVQGALSGGGQNRGRPGRGRNGKDDRRNPGMGAGMNDVIDFSKDGAGSDADEVRRESWPVKGPAELEVSVDVGRITVHVDSDSVEEVTVEVRHDPTVGGGWAQGLTGLVNWLGNATGAPAGDPARLAVDAVAAVEISWSEPARRLVVRSSQELPLRVVPLEVTITAPQGSRIAARTGAGDVTVTGTAGWAAVRTGAGSATLDAVDGDADVTTGSGDIAVGPVSGRTRVRTGSGAIRLADLGGDADVKTGSGDVELGVVSGDLGVRTGSGDLRIADARSGRYELTTGSGELRVGVHAGVTAEVDLSSGSGSARSDLEVGGSAPAGGAAVHVRGRTGSGDVLVTRAVPV